MNKRTIQALLADATLASLASQYDPPRSDAGSPRLAERLAAYAKQLTAERFVLPIAGIQGSGKSTLLNALAFDEPVLPIDADETTCVPVEISWAAQASRHATVHYLDGRSESLPCTEEALRSVVHNEHNPGNERQVARVVLESGRDMFRHGLVLVDLPGVGSLTAANKATTQRYLSEAVGVIFMLRTVPPLTRSEAMFVSLQWSSLPTALFVQNRWNDETDEEALAGRDHNVKVLKSIAGQTGIRLDKSPEIRVVNGYQALNATLIADARLADLSGLTALRAELDGFGSAWSGRVATAVVAALDADLMHLMRMIDSRLEEAKLDRSAHQKHMQQESQRFIERLQAIDERAAEMESDADSFRRTVRQQLRTWSGDMAKELRNRMRTKMRAGIVDGPRLKQALFDEQSQATDDIFEQIQQDALAAQDRLRGDLEGLDSWSADAPDLRFGVDKEESTKFENMGGRLGSIAGGLGGGAAGIWAAAEAGALIGTALGPVGTAVGAVVGGLLGGIAGLWIGNKTKEGITGLRIKAVESDVFAAIDRYVDETSRALNHIAEDFCAELEAVLDAWRASKTGEFEEEQKHSLGMLNMSAAEKSRAAESLQADRKAVESLRNRVSEVAA